MSRLLITGVRVHGRAEPDVFDVLIGGGRIVAIDPTRSQRHVDHVIEGAGGTLLPGLHDHHVHLRALAAALDSVPVGPAHVADVRDLARVLDAAARTRQPEQWVRAVGYHESVAGPLDREVLDQLVASVPVRVQHRSGAMWFVNSAAIDALGLDRFGYEGIERDASGHPTGRLFRADAWLRELVPRAEVDLERVGREAAAMGVTGFTDADPERTGDDLVVLRQALPQRILAMGPVGLPAAGDDRVAIGPVKVLLDDDALPSPDELAELVTAAHAEDRAVAFHCVTRSQLITALLAIETAGANGRDRVEHGALIPDELITRLRAAGITVVTQPNFIAERGDEYLRDVETGDRELLYRCASLLREGIAVAAGTDAPFGGADPWASMRAAVERTTRTGTAVGEAERVDAATALRFFIGTQDTPGEPRTIEVGAPADLCLIDGSVADAILAGASVRGTVVAGEVIYER